MDSPLIIKAIEFAGHIHRNQKRKFSDSPYIVHPLHVAGIVSSYTQDEDVIAAAVLHDVIEDSEENEKVTSAVLADKFNKRVAGLVEDLSVRGIDSMETKKESRQHILSGGWEGQVVKIADIISNTLWNTMRLESHSKEEIESGLNENLEDTLVMNREFIDAISNPTIQEMGIIKKAQNCFENHEQKLRRTGAR